MKERRRFTLKKVLLIAVALMMMASVASASWTGVLTIQAGNNNLLYGSLGQTYFGVDPEFADYAGDSGFAPGSGLFSTAFGAPLSHKVTWHVVGSGVAANPWTFVLVHQNISAPANTWIGITNAGAEGVAAATFNPSAIWVLKVNGQVVMQDTGATINDPEFRRVVNLGSNAPHGSLVEFEVIPEPGTMVALGSGLVGLVGFAIRRRK